MKRPALSLFSLPAALGLALMLTVSPVYAQDGSEETPSPDPETPGTENPLPEEARALLQEMLARLSESMAGLVDILPRYGMPRINEEGDIVIPRLEPPEERDSDEPQKDKTKDATETKETREI